MAVVVVLVLRESQHNCGRYDSEATYTKSVVVAVSVTVVNVRAATSMQNIAEDAPVVVASVVVKMVVEVVPSVTVVVPRFVVAVEVTNAVGSVLVVVVCATLVCVAA